MATIQHIFCAPRKRLPMEELEEALAVENSGIPGCAHSRPYGPRQVLLMDSETLELMDLRPGSIRENITTRGINVNGFAVGKRFSVGQAELEVSMVCAVRVDGKNRARSTA